jgi:hypothetical protein
MGGQDQSKSVLARLFWICWFMVFMWLAILQISKGKWMWVLLDFLFCAPAIWCYSELILERIAEQKQNGR